MQLKDIISHKPTQTKISEGGLVYGVEHKLSALSPQSPGSRKKYRKKYWSNDPRMGHVREIEGH